MTGPQPEAVRETRPAHGLRAELAPRLYAELGRAISCEMVWVMNLDWYKRIRRELPGYKPEDDDEAKWVPSIEDRMLGQRILVRDGGGAPHIEWMTREEMGL